MKALYCPCLVCLLAACGGEKLVLGGDGDAGCMPGTYVGTYQCNTDPDSSLQATGSGSMSVTLVGDRGGPNLFIASGTKVSSTQLGIETTSDLSGSLDCLTNKIQGTLSQVSFSSASFNGAFNGTGQLSADYDASASRPALVDGIMVPPEAQGTLAGLQARWSELAASFVIGGITGAALYAGLTERRSPGIVYVDRPVPALASAIPAPFPSADATGITAVTATAAVSVPHQVSSATRLSQLSAERMVLDEARGALVQHDAQRALDALDRHRRTFANALLAEERDAMQVQALVAAGRYDEARLRANSFRKRTRDSLFLPMVDAAIASIP